MSIKALQDYTYYSKYARYNKKAKRRETWSEAIDRVKSMHLAKYATQIAQHPEIKDEIEWAFEQSRQKKVLGSQRALQFGGEPILRKNARIYNCFSENTPFVTSHGVRTFADFSDGDRVMALTHKGNWMPAVVRSYGKQSLNRITINRGKATYEVDVTADHRWILKGGTETTSLKEGDRLAFAPNIFKDFVYEESLPDERLYWAYGFTYGDGTKIKDSNGVHRYSMVRLCGEDIKYLPRFEELGFLNSSSHSLEGDVMAYTGKYLKTLPNLRDDSPRLIRAFVRGLLDADGEKNKNNDSPNPYLTIQATGEETIHFIREAFPVAGVYIVSEDDLTGQETNFGTRTEKTVRFRIINGLGHTAANFTVDHIEENVAMETVWCLEVKEDHSFVMPNGLPTGNCTVSFCDRIRFFQEAFWLLLCGCGVGFSVQKHHIAKLPKFSTYRRNVTKKFLIPDSIEGWSDALGILLASYLPHPEFAAYEGYKVKFDYSLIRKAGSSLSSGSGKAPGPEPLRRSIEIIRKLLDDCLERGQDRMRSIDAYDIIMHASDAVLSGGVRRSASICLFSPDDEEMVKAKTGNWFIDNPQRGRSNNSALLLRGSTKKEDFLKLIESVKEFGEPGFVWSDSTELVVNPCVVGDTIITTEHGLQTAVALEGKNFSAVVDGELYSSDGKGFWKTGIKKVIEIEFASGRCLTVTPEHKIMTISGWKQADELTSDDEVVINNHRKFTPSKQTDFRFTADKQTSFEEFSKGYCLGNFLADGNVSKNSAQMKWWGTEKEHCRRDGLYLLRHADWCNAHHKDEQNTDADFATVESKKLLEFAQEKKCLGDNKQLSKEAICGSWDYLAGLVAGYFDADGTVAYNSKKGSSLRITSAQIENLRNLQIVLNAFGVYSKIYYERYSAGERKLPDGKGGQKLYYCQATHELCISCDNIGRFFEMIPIRNHDKWKQINLILDSYRQTPNRTVFLDKIVKTTCQGEQPVYDANVETVHAFDANGVCVHNCVEIGMWPVCEKTEESGWQMCVSADTKLLTKNGLVEIGSVVGCKSVEIWNGVAWSKVAPFQTGSNRKLYRVWLSDGSYLDCTDNHKWLVKDRFDTKYKEVETKDLMNCSKYAIHTPPPEIHWEGVIDEPNAYELGFILGDGCCNRNDTISKHRTPQAHLFKEDQALGLNCRIVRDLCNENGTPFQAVSFDHLNPGECWKLKYEHGLPPQVFFWNRKSCYDFIAGWIDSDGAKASRGFRVYGRYDKLVDLQLLFTKLGFYSSLNKAADEGEKTNFGTRRQDLWYVQVSDTKDLYSRRLELKNQPRQQAGKGMYQIVEKVEELPGLHDTYCVTEPELHQCVFNNVMTKQCNLCEQNGRKIKSKEDWKIAARAAAIIGTLQAGYTDFDYLGPVTKRIVERESLLGCSLTGMMDNPEVIFDAATQREIAKYIVKINKELAPKLGIRPCARATCVKPAGTTSCVLGTGSGIHPHHAKRYLRRVQGNLLEAPLLHFKKVNPHAVEKSVWSANETDEVISFCVEVPDGGKTKNDLDAITLLEYVKLTQANWVTAGCVKDRCTQPWLMHNVSNTINIRPDEWEGVANFIFDNRKFFAGISLLPISGDKDYPQAPMCAIYSPREMVQMYGDGMPLVSGLIVDGMHTFENNLWKACDAALGQGEALIEPTLCDAASINIEAHRLHKKWQLKMDWVRRAKQFAERYFEGDVRNMTYCLKDVNNWKTWLDLKRSYQDVDYTTMQEDSDETVPVQEWACSGQSCEMR